MKRQAGCRESGMRRGYIMVKKINIERITSGMVQYPDILREIKNYPKELYCAGDISLLKKRCVSVVGSRSTTVYGRNTAVKFAGDIARAGFAVVSGMARGIDTCSHRGALNAGGSTIAVLGCGLNHCYPKENAELMKEIEETGLVISEYPPDAEPQRYFFPQRNRIISGLSELTLIVQARNNSGALITADLAAEQGKEVCAVPGNIDSQYNMGSNKLIKEGAVPVLSTGDLLEMLGAGTLEEKEAERILSENEMRIYRILCENGELSTDELCGIIGKPPSYVAGIVTVMEMKGVVFSAMGKVFIAKA
jgi:DNA processing protein